MKAEKRVHYEPPRVLVFFEGLPLSLLTSLSAQSDEVWDYGTEPSDVEDYGVEPSGIGG